MGILDRLFGSDDPVKDELDKAEKKKQDDDVEETKMESESIDPDSEDWPPENILYGKKCWPYQMKPVDSDKLAGRELYTHDDGGNLWMGKDIRDMIENRRYAPEDPTRIGYTKDNVKGVQDVYIDHNALFRHIALFGQTGYGKSTLMRNIMLQWIHAGYGICYIDPKGDDSYELLQQIPPDRIDDVVWVEPASDKEKQVGFNVFATESSPGDPLYEREVNSVAGDFTEILKDKSEHWGPQIGNITETLIKQLIRAEDPFNPIDLVKIITDEEERRVFAENYGDELEQVFMERIAEQDQAAFDPILRRVRSWVEDRTTRQIMAHEKSKINISEAVRDGKLLIVNTSSIEQMTTKEIVTRMIISRVWSTIRTRKTDTETEPTPYFLCIDEFDKVISDSFDINRIISQARSFRLSVFVANQQPSQLPDDVKQALQQVQSLMSFNPGNNPADAQDIAHVLGDVDAWELGDLDRFTVVGRPYMNGSQQSAVIIHTYGEYPPLREKEDAEQIVQRSLEKYGTKPNINTDIDAYGAKRFIDSRSSGHEINKQGDTITDQQLLECVYTAQLRNDNREIDGEDDWVTLEQIQNEVNKYARGIAEAHSSKLSQVLEGFTSREMEQTVSDKAYFRLGNEGLKKAFEPDTGAAASGGKSPHRILLRKGHTAFTKLGYDVTLPSQDQSGSLPDGLAEPPINPMEESQNFDEAVEKEVELVKKYPRLAQLFGDREIALEAESTTITRPAQTIKNLVKAVQNNRHCVFLVKDGTPKRGKIQYWARVGTDILTDPPFVRSVDEHGNRTFYTTNMKVQLSNKGRALVPKDVGQSSWSEYGKQYDDPNEASSIKIQLNASNSDEPLATFDDATELARNPRPSEFPFHYVRDTQSQQTVVKDRNGDVVDRYENLGELQRDGKYKIVHMPIIPDYEFPGGEYPSDDDWTFIIIPESNNEGPKIYDRGDMEPLLPEDGAKIDLQDFDDLQISMNVEELVPEEQVRENLDNMIVEPGTESSDLTELDDKTTENDQLEEKQSSAVDPFEDLDDDEEEDIGDEIGVDDLEDIDDMENDEEEDDEEEDDEEEGTDPTSIADDHMFPDPPDVDDD